VNAEEFKKHGYEMIDYIANFLEKDVHEMPIQSKVALAHEL
jgi:hypothetical protein